MRQDSESGAALDAEPDDMAGRTASFDWATTPLGARADWPQSLRTAVDIMLACGHAMCIAWGPERVFLYNDAYAPILGARHPGALGGHLAQVWPDVWDDIAPLVRRTFEGESLTFRDMPLVMTRNGYEEQTWWSFTYSPIRGEGGEVAGLLNVTADTTPRVLAEQQRDTAIADLRASEEFTRSVLAASIDCIKVVELDGSLSFMSDGGMKVMEVSDFNQVKGCYWPDFLRGGEARKASEALEAARAGRSSTIEAAADTFAGTPKFWSVSVSPILDGEGRVARILSVSRDLTELEQSREQQRLLTAELGHRLKNVLTVVQSIAGQTLRGAESVEAAGAAFASRLASLGEATSILTAGSWQPAELSAVIDAGLAVVEARRSDITVRGPSLRLNPQAALAFTLAIHELATNAIKYGALTAETGTLSLSWTVEDRGGEPHFAFVWKELGGPPVATPEKSGFGTRMIERSLRSYFRGETKLSYPPDGLEFRIDAPLKDAVEAGA